jgi:hypothetical protein
VGNGDLTLGEQRAHFALWAVLKAPLLVGSDLRTLAPESLAILTNRDLIAINQDELGVAGDLVWKQGSLEARLQFLTCAAVAVLVVARGVRDLAAFLWARIRWVAPQDCHWVRADLRGAAGRRQPGAGAPQQGSGHGPIPNSQHHRCLLRVANSCCPHQA